MKTLRLGTRGSDLALWQARHIAALLSPEVEVELVVLQTRGDRIDDRPLTEVAGKAFFTAEIERALLDGSVDLAVHSHKDLPTEGPAGLVIAAVPPRGPAQERLLVTGAAHALDAPLLPLRHGASVGTSSPRREQQLRTLRPDLRITSLRGNVPTRVARLREGRHDAILLAAAGLHRLQLDLAGLHVHDLSPALLVPAPAQGALAVQVRAGDVELQELCLRRLHHEETHARIEAERLLLSLAGGGCNLPLGAFIERAFETRVQGRDGARDARADASRDGGPDAGRDQGRRTAGEPWHARAFLGADHPRAGCAARWADGRGRTPEQAARAVLAVLQAPAPTGVGPLAGLRVALAGSSEDSGPSSFAERLAQLGAHVTHEALIAFEDVACPQLAERVSALRAGDVLAVTSRQAALRLAAGCDPSAGVRVAAVGPSTARALEHVGLRADVIGCDGARALAQSLDIASGARVLFPCAEGARTELSDVLAARGAQVERLVVYRTHPASPPPARTDCDARVYCSPSVVDAALAAWGPAARTDASRALALGATTARALVAHGLAAPAKPASSATPVAPVAPVAQATLPEEVGNTAAPDAWHEASGDAIESVVAALVRMYADAARSESATA